MQLKYTLGISFLLCGPAMAQDVYPGCEVPTPVAGHRTFYVDPVRGTDGGDGSPQRPWRNLNTVFAPASKLIATKRHAKPSGTPLLAVDPNAPIKGGDTIMLMSGDHGDVTLMNTFNDKFITVTPAPGQKPIIQHLKVAGAARWVFQGLTFQHQYPSGSKPSATGLVNIMDGWGDTTKDVVLDQNTYQATDDTSTWTDADWFVRPDFWGIVARATCITITNSTIQNAINGITVIGPRTLVKNNLIQKFSVDAIDGSASYLSIVGNTIKDGMFNSAGTLHPDAIQTWSPQANGKITDRKTDILIDSNKIYAAKSPGDNRGIMQGITVGFSDEVVIQNNVIAVNLWNAIILNGAHNGRIINNTVVPSDPVNHPSKIYVGSTAFSTSQNIIVRNNISKDISAHDESITMDNNIVSRTFDTLEGGKVVWHGKGIAASNNQVSPSLEANFRNWHPAQGNFDLHLSSSSTLNRMGSQAMAPSLDADGLKRATPSGLGAYTR